MRIDAPQLAVFDECGDDRPAIAPFVRAGEERVLPIQSEAAAPLKV
jgi:hypothetical protein